MTDATKGIGAGADLGVARLAESKTDGVLRRAAQKSDVGKMEEAAAQFEALLVQQMFGAMWQAIPKDGLLSGSREEELFRDLFHEALAEEVSKSQSLGIKEIILKEMKAQK